MHAFHSTRRRTAAAAVALAAVVVLAACGEGGSGGSTAARIGDTKVADDTVFDAVDRALAAGQTKLTRQELTAQHLTTHVKLALLRAEAAKLQVVLSDDDRKVTRAAFEEETAASGGLDKAAAVSGYAPQDLADVVEMAAYERLLAQRLMKDKPVTDAELDELRAKQPQAFADQAQAAHILVKDEALAKQLLTDIKAGGDFAALAAKHSTDPGSKDKGGDLGTNPKGTFVPEFDAALFGGKKGDIVGPVKTEFGYHIIKVVDIKTYESAKEEIRTGAAPTVGRDRLRADLGSISKVTVNERFGTWNPEKMVVEVAKSSSEEPSRPSGAADPEPVLPGTVESPAAQ